MTNSCEHTSVGFGPCAECKAAGKGMIKMAKAYLLLLVDTRPAKIDVPGHIVDNAMAGARFNDLRKIGAGIYGDKLITMRLDWRSFVVIEREAPSYGEAQDAIIRDMIANPYWTWLLPYLEANYADSIRGVRASLESES